MPKSQHSLSQTAVFRTFGDREDGLTEESEAKSAKKRVELLKPYLILLERINGGETGQEEESPAAETESGTAESFIRQSAPSQ